MVWSSDPSETSIKRRDREMSNEGEEGGDDTNLFSKLPEGLMEQVVSHTSPVDACRLSVVSKSFRSAAGSDAVWERLLPNDYQQYLCRTDFLPCISFASKKDLYLFLTGNPLIDANTKSFFFLDKWTGKKCFTITSLSITLNPEGLWNPTYRETRFVEVFETPPCDDWLEIHGKIRTFMLSPHTSYATYLVYKWETYGGYYFPAENRAPLEAVWTRFGCYFPAENRAPFEASVGSSEDESVKRVVYLHRIIRETGSQYPVGRKDGWLEVELGEYFNKGGKNKDLEISVIDGLNKFGFIMQGIEIRPKHS
ncbi:putative F-box protein PP2-B12 isoform X2 [Daucus carota subsp. sativus]|uniref:putative F-box protein PP2-B12 isoform X2 n=1 Tax=Daucus carota subsp. sativus TaxID=79200 RepID=UPI0007EF6263|nr:PREDICTED: putative F-box protein PP2-B12 isoform X2 [Daucus carota subsp. sativus]